MRTNIGKLSWRTAMIAVLAAMTSLGTVAAKGKKLKLDQFLAEQAAALGTLEALKDRTNCLARGKVQMRILTGGQGQLVGPLVVASEPERSGVKFIFSNPSYMQEAVVSNAGKVEVAFIVPGTRSPLGDFLFTHDRLVSEGLFGGVLNVSWPLAANRETAAKLKYKGVKKVDGDGMHMLEYRPKGGAGGVKISLYFDQETFLHRRSVYKIRIPAGIGATPEESARLRETIRTLREEFSDFRNVQGINLPSRWRILYSDSNGVQTWEWKAELDWIEFNQEIPDEHFNIEYQKQTGQ